MLMKKIFSAFATFCLTFYAVAGTAHAVQLEADGGWKFGINGFVEADLTYMGAMAAIKMDATGNPTLDPVTGEAVLNTGDETVSLDQGRLNVITSAEKDNMKVVVNMGSFNGYSSDEGGKGQFEFEEVFGQVGGEKMKLTAGMKLAPFGIYNDTFYMTPLFASVVLPFMYEMPPNYNTSNAKVASSFMPHKANLMLSGNLSGDGDTELDYAFYISNGYKTKQGGDNNKDKGVGGRLRLFMGEDQKYKLGASYYTAENDRNDPGRKSIMGLDVDLIFLENFQLEAEYVSDSFAERKDRASYYARLIWLLEKYSPFISYDYVKDDGNELYKKGLTRLSIGAKYEFSPYVTLKGEYHRHMFTSKDEAPALPDGTDAFDMLRVALIFVF